MNMDLHPTKKPWLRLLTFLCIICIGVFIGQLAISLYCNLAGSTIYQSPTMDTQAYRKFLLITQVILASNAFIGAPLFYWHFIEKKSINDFFQGNPPYAYKMLLTIGLLSSFMVVNSVFVQWNIGLKMPTWLEGFERWALAQEATLKHLTELLTTFHSPNQLLIGILVMGIIPGIGEELLFRGVLQGLLHAMTKNIHIAICLSAFIFSAVHIQFYGFIPRFLLGLLFGYIYWWTKDLSLAMLAHFFNNAFTLIALFFYQHAFIAYDIKIANILPVPIIFCSLMSVILAIFLKRSNNKIHT